MSFYALAALFNAFTSFCLGCFVFFKNRRGAVNRSYALLSLSLAFWSVCYCIWLLAREYELALLWMQLLTVGSIFIPSFFLYFILCFLRKQHKKRNIIRSTIAISFILAPLTFLKAFIPAMRPKLGFDFWPDAGILYSMFLVFFFCCVVYAIIILVRAYLSEKESEYRRAQMWYVIVASIVGFVGGSTNYPLWYNIPIPPFFNALVGIHVLILAYAIVKYRLMDIRAAVTRTTIFVAVYALVLGVPFVLSTAGKPWLIQVFSRLWWTVPLVLMAFLGTVGPFMYIFLRNRAEAILMKEQRKYQAALKAAAVDLTRIRHLQKLLDYITQLIAESVKVSHSAVYFFDVKEDHFVIKSGVSIPQSQPQAISKDNPLVQWFMKHKQPVIYEEICHMLEESEGSEVLKKLKFQMETLHAEIAVPCFLEGKLLDIMLLGEKSSGKLYYQDDVDNFKYLAGEIALATENALLYDKIENEVKQRTHELVETQKQLVQAEKLATVGTLAGGVAHEINNPLTAILTSVEMIMSYGSGIDEDSKESLRIIQEATHRCTAIVKKLMTYARKPIGPQEHFGKVNILSVVNDVVSFLGYQLKQDNIQVQVNNSHIDYPVHGIENELDQVVTNMVLNAKDAIIKKKKNGTITISLDEKTELIVLKIRDDGCGIPKEVIPKIFDPFFTTKEVGKGVGLGLSICHSIIEKHDGKITVESEPGHGTVFTVYLPKFK